jgi:nitroreductase
MYDAVRTVLAIRSFADTPIPADVVRQIVDAGYLTGSSMNKQPWHFLVVQNRETLAKIGSLAKSGPYIAQAAMAIVVLIERTPYAISDASRAIQSMVLTAWSAGIGSNWVGFVGFGGVDDLKPLLNIPEQYDVLAILPFGYPTKQVGQGKKVRKPWQEVVSSERFGEALGQA